MKKLDEQMLLKVVSAAGIAEEDFLEVLHGRRERPDGESLSELLPKLYETILPSLPHGEINPAASSASSFNPEEIAERVGALLREDSKKNKPN